ncbi:MAG: hypothetical protein RLZZ329_501, partial [Pseudomonadota bacterium]
HLLWPAIGNSLNVDLTYSLDFTFHKREKNEHD